MRLAGTYHPIPYLLERLSHYLPGIVEKNALWIDFDKQLYTSYDNSPLQNHLKVKAQSVRNTAITHEWHNHSDLFTNVKSDKTQLSLEDENALHVLRIYFTSPIDQLKDVVSITRSEEHTSELQSRPHLVCRLLLEKKKKTYYIHHTN